MVAASGRDRLQWQFNDTDRTVKNQSTGNVRGEAVESIRPGVLASKITVIIQETSRPPAVAPTNVAPAPGPGGGTSILGGILGGSDNPQSSAPGPLVGGPIRHLIPRTERLPCRASKSLAIRRFER